MNCSNGISITNQNNSLKCCRIIDQSKSNTLLSCTKLNSFSQLNQSSNLLIKTNQSDECEQKLRNYYKRFSIKNQFILDLRDEENSFYLDNEFNLDLIKNFSDSNSTEFDMNILGTAGVDLRFNFNYFEICNDFCFFKSFSLTFSHSQMNLLNDKSIYRDKCDIDLIKTLTGHQNIDQMIKFYGYNVEFYIGISERPVERFQEHQSSGYTQMHVMLFPDSKASGNMEKRLISTWQKHPRCMNAGPGGLRASEGKPHFCYIVCRVPGLTR